MSAPAKKTATPTTNRGNILVEDQDLIEGGDVDISEEVPFNKERHQAETARFLAGALIILLGGIFVLHYLAIMVLFGLGKGAGIEYVEKAFNSSLPVVAGLVGSAATYYFTKEKHK